MSANSLEIIHLLSWNKRTNRLQRANSPNNPTNVFFLFISTIEDFYEPMFKHSMKKNLRNILLS